MVGDGDGYPVDCLGIMFVVIRWWRSLIAFVNVGRSWAEEVKKRVTKGVTKG